jgi:hypothetical protein
VEIPFFASRGLICLYLATAAMLSLSRLRLEKNARKARSWQPFFAQQPEAKKSRSPSSAIEDVEGQRDKKGQTAEEADASHVS